MIYKDFTLIGINFEYLLYVDYHSSYPYGRCECSPDDYCRCMVINEEDVTIDTSELSPSKLLNLFIENELQYKRECKISETLDDVNINLYAIGRIISINKMYSDVVYTPSITGGYYGEEFEGLYLNDEVAKKVTEEILFILMMDTIKEKIEYLLTLEYNHLLEDLCGKKWKIVNVDKDDIHIPNKKHFNNIINLDFYNDSHYTEIRCVISERVKKVGKKYKLIDGYHRLKNTKKNKVKCIIAY